MPLPIQRLRPLRTTSPPSGRADVSSRIASDPWSGSVSANAPIASTRASGPSQRSFCCSEPCAAIDRIASPACTPANVARLPSPRLSSMAMIPADGIDMSGQP